MVSAVTNDFIAELRRDIDLSVDAFNKAYRVIESCKTVEQLGLARSYVSLVEDAMIERMLPICQVLHTMLTVRLTEVRVSEE